MLRTRIPLIAALFLGYAPFQAQAQQVGVRRSTLQEQRFPAPRFHTITVRVELAKAAKVAPHRHPGIEMAYIVAGEARLALGRQVRRLTAGDSFSVPSGAVHALSNVGEHPLIVLSTYVLEVGKPIATPAR